MTFSQATVPTPWVVRSHNIDTMTHGPAPGHIQMGPTAQSYPGANLAIYVPVRVQVTAVVKKLWISVGLTATGNVDCGLYSAGGTRLVSIGSTAKNVTSTEQVYDVTDTTIGAGLYYLAMSCDGTESFYADIDAAPLDAGMGLLSEQLANVTLPATATWSVPQTLAFYPRIGMLLETTVA